MTIWYKQGVIGLHNLHPKVQKAKRKVHKLYASRGQDLYVTSLAEGTHSPGSFHHIFRAFDFRKGIVKLSTIKQKLGSEYDVIGHNTHYHVEYDPK